MSDHPYRDLPADQFWATGVASAAEPMDLVRAMPHTVSPSDPVATAGSCFAQHLAPFLRESGYNFFLAEQPGPTDEPVFSARTGAIQTARQLHQLLLGAFGLHRPAARAWRRTDGRFVDPLRPLLFPAGFSSEAEVTALRRTHLGAVRRVFQECRVFVFTLGSTEAWLAPDGTVLPVPPAAVAARADEGDATFHNFTAAQTRADLEQFLTDLVAVNPGVRVILTVSPVPVAATYMPRHILVSNSYSKAALLVAAEEMAASHARVAYFPSYEIATAPNAAARYLAEDMRQVTPAGVAEMMRLFRAHGMRPQGTPAADAPVRAAIGEEALGSLFDEAARGAPGTGRVEFVAAALPVSSVSAAGPRQVRRSAAVRPPRDAAPPQDDHELTDAASLVRRGLRYKRTFRYALAERDFRRALTLDPNAAEAMLNLGYILRDTRRVQEAITLFRKMMAVTPDHWAIRARHETGMLLNSIGRHAEAARTLRPMLETGDAYFVSEAVIADRIVATETRGLRDRLARRREPVFGDDNLFWTAMHLRKLGWPEMAIRLLGRIENRAGFAQRISIAHFFAAWEAESISGAIEALLLYREAVPAGNRQFSCCLALGLLQQGRVAEALVTLGHVVPDAQDDEYRELVWRASATADTEVEKSLPVMERAVDHAVSSKTAGEYIASLAILGQLHVFIEDDPHTEAGLSSLVRPKVIVQFWDTDMPDEVRQLVTEWQVENPTWQHALFSEATALVFIHSHFGSELAELFSFCHHPAMKADFFRLCYLYVSGGVYLDADEKLAMKADDYFEGWENAGFVAAVSGDLPFYIHNQFICAMPGHPILRIAIELMQADLAGFRASREKPNVWRTTGPGCITRAVAIYCRQVLAEGTLSSDDLVLITDDKYRRFAHSRDLSYKQEAKGNWRLA